MNKGCRKILTQTLSPLFFGDGNYPIQWTALLSSVFDSYWYSPRLLSTVDFTQKHAAPLSLHRSKRRTLSYSRMHASGRKQNCGIVLEIICVSFFKEKPVTL